MKYLSFLADKQSARFVANTRTPETMDMGAMGMEDTCTNATLSERIENQECARARETAEATAGFANERFASLYENLVTAPGIEEKVAKPKSKSNIAGKKSETAETDEAPDAASEELQAGLEAANINMNTDLKREALVKADNEAEVRAQVEEAMTVQLTGAENGVSEGGQDTASQMG